MQALILPYSGPIQVSHFLIPSIKDCSDARLIEPASPADPSLNVAQSTMENMIIDKIEPKLAELDILESSKSGSYPGCVVSGNTGSMIDNATKSDNVDNIANCFEQLPYSDCETPVDHLVSVNRACTSDLYSPYVNLEINGYKTVFLVDTGATYSILNRSHAVRLGIISADCLPDNTRGKTATGSPIACYGKHRVDVKLGCRSFSGPIEVADISENGFMGMDFLTAFNCVLDFNEMKLKMCQQSVSLVNSTGKRLVCSCYSVQATTIDPHSESIIPLYSHTTTEGGGLIEPNFRVVDSLNLIAARCYVDDYLVIRVANVTSHPIHISQDKPLAFLTDGNIIEMDDSAQLNNTVTRQCDLSAETDTQHLLPEHIQPLYDNLPDYISDECKTQMRQLLLKYQDVFSRDAYDMGYCDLVPHEIHLKPGTQPIRLPPYRVGHHANLEIEKHVQELLKKGIIERTVSPYSAPVLLIAKKDGTSRFVQDYRKLNKATYIPSQPLPRIDDSLEALKGATLFSTFDLLSGYWQCALSPDAKEMVAFCTKSGVYTWRVLGMGLCGAPATFERLMEKVMQGLQWESLLIYLDDIIVFSPDETTHVQRLDNMLERLKNANLKIKVSKTHLLKQEVEFLGHIVNKDGIHTDPAKVKAIKEAKTPTCIQELRSFLGLTGYYRKFVAKYAEIAVPLFELLKKKSRKKQFPWDDKCEQAFQMLKDSLAAFTTLSYPDWDIPFILDSDCSGEAMGAVLAQHDSDGDEKPIAFFSKKLSDSQKKYPVTKQEMLALVSAIRHFHTYLYGSEFICRVDHHSLIWLHNLKNPQGILARWLEVLGSYKFTVIHRPGIQHTNADALSRLPALSPQTEDTDYDDADFVVRNVDFTVGLSTDELILAQSEDPQLIPIIENLKENKTISQKDCKQFSRITRHYIGKIPSMKFKDGVLMITTHPENEDKIVVPQYYQSKLMKSFHEMDHSGMDRTESRIKLYYYWYGMQSDIRLFIQTCSSCQLSKLTRNQVNNRNLVVGSIMDQVSLDFIGPLQRTTSDNTYILIAVEHFSRWAEAYPLAQPDAESCALNLHRGLFSRFGYCRILHSDRGSAFISELMKEFSNLGQAKQTFSARYHPMGNSYAERVIGTVTSQVRTCVEHTRMEWDQLLDTVLMAYRATPHSATGFSPNMIMLGREVRLPAVLSPPIDDKPVTDHVRQLNDKLKYVYNKCRGPPNIQLEGYDHLIHKPYKVGDLVLIKKVNPTKLETKFSGPCHVVKVLDFDTYVISEKGKEIIEHHSRLKLFKSASVANINSNIELDPNTAIDHDMETDMIYDYEPNYEQHEADISEQIGSSSGRDSLPDSNYTPEDISEGIPPDLEFSSSVNTNQSPTPDDQSYQHADKSNVPAGRRQRKLPSKYKDYQLYAATIPNKSK